MGKKDSHHKATKIIPRLLSEVIRGEVPLAEHLELIERLGLRVDESFRPQLEDVRLGIDHMEDAPGALDDVLQNAPLLLTLAAVDTLTRLENAEQLARIRDRNPDREARKRASAALHTLEARGIQAPPPPQVSRSSAAPPTAEAYVSHRDPAGDFLLWVFLPLPGNETIYFMRMSEVEGVASFDFDARTARGERRELRNETGQRNGIIPVSLPHAIFLIQEGMDRSHARHDHVPLELAALIHTLEDLGFTGAQQQPQNGETLRPLTLYVEEQHLDLVARKEVIFWQVSPSALEPPIRQMMEAASSPIALSEEQKRARTHRIFEEATEVFFTPERRLRGARRLEDLALHLEEAQEKDLMEQAWGSALALRDATIPIGQIAFARSFLELKVMLLIHELFPDSVPAGAGPGIEADAPPVAEEAEDDDAPRIILP